MLSPNSAELTYRLPGFQRRVEDTLELRAPVSEGAVLINSYDIPPPPEPVLAVTIAYPTVTIARIGSIPLQIADLSGTRRSLVLQRPVPALVAMHQEESAASAIYTIQRDDGLRVQDHEGLGFFLDLIATRLARAERRKREAAAQIRLNELLSSF